MVLILNPAQTEDRAESVATNLGLAEVSRVLIAAVRGLSNCVWC